MDRFSWEPRTQWDNSPSNSHRGINQDPWYDNYEVLSNVNDGLNAIFNGLEIGSEGSTDSERAITFARFCQGLSQGYLGLFFDKGFIVTEETDFYSARPAFVPYNQLMNTGLEHLEECIRLCSEYDFQLPPTWINGYSFTNDELAKLCHSFIARYMVHKARSNAEREAVDWELVLSHIDQGITEDFAPEGDDNMWWHPVQYSSNWNGWYVVDNKLHGPSDTSDNYKNWLTTSLENRTHFINYSTDRRVTGDISGTTDGKYFYYNERQFLYASRGTYVWSRYRFQRYDYQYPVAYGPMPHLTKCEMDMLRAEAYLRGFGGGTKADIAELINMTRVQIGEMEPLDGTESELELWKWMCYEKRMETMMTGISYYDYRGWADLTIDGEYVVQVPEGTIIHWPVPGRELEILMEENYTFGGVGQPGATYSVKSSSGVIDAEYIIAVRERLNRENLSKQTIPRKK
ncbi:hypothetical protein ACFL6O_00130 [candidate division KSB1 bacterium]